MSLLHCMFTRLHAHASMHFASLRAFGGVFLPSGCRTKVIIVKASDTYTLLIFFNCIMICGRGRSDRSPSMVSTCLNQLPTPSTACILIQSESIDGICVPRSAPYTKQCMHCDPIGVHRWRLRASFSSIRQVVHAL